ncbi:sigma factor-like helix-turn-helix DNA-binding protein, partial [Bacillus paralicheniformis]
LSALTAREKEIFILHKVEQFSYERIAAMLGIKKSTVQTNVKRAQLKIAKQIEKPLDCMA